MTAVCRLFCAQSLVRLEKRRCDATGLPRGASRLLRQHDLRRISADATGLSRGASRLLLQHDLWRCLGRS